MDWTRARQDAIRSGDALLNEQETIPSLHRFTAGKIVEKMALENPAWSGIDPDRTVVRVEDRRRILPSGESRVVATKEYTLTEFALRNTSVWREPVHMERTLLPNVELPVLSTERVAAGLADKDGAPIMDASGQQVTLNTGQLNSFVRTLDAGKQYTDFLTDRISPASGSSARDRLQTLWTSATRDRLQAERLKAALDPATKRTFKWETRDPAAPWRELKYVDAVINHPDASQRPKVEGHTVVANSLILGAATDKGAAGQTINGVAVIGSSTPGSSPGLVLYTPDAPDGIALRGLDDIKELEAYAHNPEWREYFKQRMATANEAEIARVLDSRSSAYGHAALRPIEGDFFKGMYEVATGFDIAFARHRSTTSGQVDALSNMNKGLFYYDAASQLAPFALGSSAVNAARRKVLSQLNKLRTPKLPEPLRPVRPLGHQAPEWGMRDPEVINRLQPGSRGGSITYQRDPVTQKEYVNVDGTYYRGEVRKGQNVIFNDRNISETRVLDTGPGGTVSIRPNSVGLGGNLIEVTPGIKREMDQTPGLRGKGIAFRMAYIEHLMANGGFAEQEVENGVREIRLGVATPEFKAQHEAAITAAQELEGNAVTRPAPGRLETQSGIESFDDTTSKALDFDWNEYMREDGVAFAQASIQGEERQKALYNRDGIPYFDSDSEHSDSGLGGSSQGSSDSEQSSTQDDWRETLSDRYEDVMLYTQDSNEYFNNYFRNDRAPGGPGAPATIGALADTLEGLPKAGDVPLFRGGSGARGTSGEAFRNGLIKEGDQLINTEFTSFTENPYLVKDYFGANVEKTAGSYKYDDSSVVFVMKEHSDARAISPLSITPEEVESLYAPGHHFEVKRINLREFNGRPLVEVEIAETKAPATTGRVLDFRTGQPFDRQVMDERIGKTYAERFFGAAG